jgi:peptidoglycan/xylan/chitin deacetylase (PgdA/CDA1 family)
MKYHLKEIIYRAIYISRVWVIFRRASRRRIRIIMYHGIVQDDIGVWTQVPIVEFEKQMKYLSRKYNVISLEAAVAILRGEATGPENPLVITFDDGFMSNKTLAYPILRKYHLPAVIFLTTSFVSRAPRFGGFVRTDYIINLFRRAAQPNLDLSDYGLGVIRLGNDRQRIAAAYRVSNALKRVDYEAENRLIDVISQRLDAHFIDEDLAIFGSMSWDDVRELRAGGLVSFGAHTVSHEILSMVPEEIMRSEIADSQREIETCLKEPVRHFAYPNGTQSDFNEDVKKVAAELFDCALSTMEGTNSPGADLYELKRIGIGNDIKLWKFKLVLSGFRDIIARLKSTLTGRDGDRGDGSPY